MFLLDTNVCISILNGSNRAIQTTFSAESPRTLRLCSVVVAELLYGARKSTQVEASLGHLSTFFAPLTSVPFDNNCAAHYGLVRASLAYRGTPIGPNDLMIAAIALANDLTLVTNNTREFNRVVGLAVVDWKS